MRVKEFDKTANVAWSPAAHHPIYMAAGTAAQQLDATFSTSASLDILSLDLAEPGYEMSTMGSVTSNFRFHKLMWSSHGIDDETYPSGLLLAGSDNGNLFVYNPDKIIKNEEALVHKLDKHVGAVAAIDVNPFQPNLVTSGASDSEIYIWDLLNPVSPMTPGSKSQPPDDVTCLAWNKQVQHILASTYAGRCVVWDLRKNEPIIKVSDSMSRIKSKLVAWHPDVATQLCLASEDDHSPVVQLWDLRFATSPLKSLESHQRGILSLAWCPQDADLLLTCGKDNRVLCWNPNSAVQTGEVMYEVPISSQWNFDVQWCPKNPALVSCCSFDGHVGVYSLMGGTAAPATTTKVADAFPADAFGQIGQQVTQSSSTETISMLKKPPKWLCRPAGASFAFGGKLVSFQHEKPPASQHPQQQQQPSSHTVQISQVITEKQLISRSTQLEDALSKGKFAEYCALKVASSREPIEENIWNFLKVNFEQDPRSQYLQLLGYDNDTLKDKIKDATGTDISGEAAKDLNTDEVAQKMALLNASDNPLAYGGSTSISEQSYPTHMPVSQQNGDGTAAFDAIATQEPDPRADNTPLAMSTDDDCEGLVTKSLLTANFEAAVEVCLHHDRMAEAVILAIAGGPELLTRTQKRFFQKNKSGLGKLISSLVTRDFEHIIRTCEIENWKESLAVALTYAKADEFANLCEILGSRLESEKDGELASNACLCYICAGKVDKLVECWNKITANTNTSTALQDLVEKVMLLRKAVELVRGQPPEVDSGLLADKLTQYAQLLAAQGSLHTAINYLTESTQPSLAALRHRLCQAMGQAEAAAPFKVQKVQAPSAAAPRPQEPQRQNQQNFTPGYHQTTAANNFQTTTTPSSTYQTYPNYSSAGQTVPTYNQMSATAAAQANSGRVLAKGPLAHKYPSYNQPSDAGYGNQPGYAQNAYGQPAATQEPAASASQPQIFDPTATAMAAPPNVAQHSPGTCSEEEDDILNASTSSLDTLRHLISNPDAAADKAADLIRTIAAGRRRSSTYSDNESLAGIVGTPPRGKIHSLSSFEYEDDSVPPGAPYQPVSSQNMSPSFQDVRPAKAWNDPPPLSSNKTERKLSGGGDYQQPAPITQPLYGGAAQDQVAPGAPSYGGGNQYYNPQQQQQQPAQGIPAAEPAKAAAPAKPVEKAPIPAEHQQLFEMFDKLVKLCMEKATNPHLKRKLEDVCRKLEALYDKLRDNSLTPNVIMGLHQMVQAIQQYDYATGLAYHTQMVSQGNFSEISSFMPGIKVLMQTATQLGVYVQ